jgi:predicted Ser/Thr protein kinase
MMIVAMPDAPSLPPASFDELRRLRPEPEEGFARRVGIGGILSAVFGAAEERPRVGRYVVQAKVAEGGMGVVYRSVDPDTDALVAVKLLHRAEPKERSRFEQEAEILRSLAHPGIVRYLEHGVADDGSPFLAMEWLEGCSLAERLRSGVLGVEAALRLALAVAEGLVAAHAAGIVHRDLKPSNLFLCAGRLNGVRIVDFGIARTSHRDAGLTSTGSVLGTPCYMAPEQIGGKQDARTDVYGLGATLFECLAGRPPFVGDEPGVVLLAVMAEPVPHLASLRKGVPPAVDALLGRMLAKEPTERPADMRAVVTELTDLLTHPGRIIGALSRQERTPRTDALAEALPTPTAFVGRLRERALLRGIVDEAVSEHTCAVVSVSGDAGVGKSRLIEAFAAEVPSQGARVFRADAAADSTGVPFFVLTQLLRSVPASAGGVATAHVLDLICRFDGAQTGLDLRALADQLRLAWFDLLASWTDAGPLVLVVDDAHRADLATLRYLEHGLRFVEELGDRSLVLVVAHRPGNVCDGLRGALPADRVFSVHLGPLGELARVRLASAWAGTGTSPATVRELARLSGGNPSHLRELCRGYQSASGPSTSLASLVWARLARLDGEARRVLRAASIVGRRFSLEALLAVLGTHATAEATERRVSRFVEEGLVHHTFAVGVFEFESELVHLGALELCTEADLQSGHRAMAAWLQTKGRGSAGLIAQHLSASGDADAAAVHFVAAARAALAVDDLAAVDAFLERAGRHAQGAQTVALVDALHAEAAFWRGDLPASITAAERAAANMPTDTESWFRVASLIISASGQRGDNDRVRQLGAAAAAQQPRDPAARDARVVAVCRAIMQLDVLALASQHPLKETLATENRSLLGADARAWVLRVEAQQKGLAGFGAIDAFVQAHRAHVEAQDLRSATQIALYLGSYFSWSGAWELARERIDEALRTSHRLGASYLAMWARYTDCKLKLETAPADETSMALRQVIEEASGSPRILAGALLYASLAAHRAGDFAEAIALARRARQAHLAPAVAVPAAAAECRALLALGQVQDALDLKADLSPSHADLSRIVEHRELVHLAVAELHHAAGNDAAALAAIVEAKGVIDARAASLVDALRRNEYLARPHLVLRTLALAKAWGAEPGPKGQSEGVSAEGTGT